MFGASDEVLGALESGVDIERRIAQVYQECRTSEEIQAAFDALQAELEEQVSSRMAETRQALLDNFDEEVHTRLKFNRKEAFASLGQREQWLLSLTRHELGGDATFDEKLPRFFYVGPEARTASYNLDWKHAEKNRDVFYRVDHPLAQKLIDRAKERTLPVGCVELDYKAHGARIAALEKYRGDSGWLELSKLTVESFESEEFLVFSACSDSGHVLEGETAEKLLRLPARVLDAAAAGADNGVPEQRLALARSQELARCVKLVDDRNGRFFDEEVAKLERWSDDLKQGLEREIKELDQQIKEIRRECQAATALTEKLAGQKKLKGVESERNRKRRELYDAQDAIDRQRDELISKIEGQLQMRNSAIPMFTIRWTIV